MKVSLIRSPAGYSTGKKPNIRRGLYLLPQALIYLGESLLRDRHEVQIIDAEEGQLFLDDVAELLCEFLPDIIGLTTTTPSWPFTEKIALRIREELPEAKIVMGGPHAVFDYQNVLSKQLADMVAIGESEHSLTDYVSAVEVGAKIDEIPGIAYISNGHTRYTGDPVMIDVDTWGLPAYHLLNMERYRRAGGVSVSAMRGCPYKCAFCLTHKIHNISPLKPTRTCKPRFKGAKTVFGEILYLHQKYSIGEFSFIDPTFTHDHDRVNELCELLVRADVGIKWCCQTRVDSISSELLANMHKAGCVGILFGVESGNEAVLEYIDKRTNRQLAVDAFEMCKSVGIHPTPSLIMGLPGDSVESVRSSIDFAEELNDRFELDNYLQFNTFMPSPGSLVQEDLEKYQIEINNKVSYAYWVLVPVTSTPNLPYERHLDLWHRVWKTFFPEYYNSYLEVEEYAFSGENPLLDIFAEGVEQDEI